MQLAPEGAGGRRLLVELSVSARGGGGGGWRVLTGDVLGLGGGGGGAKQHSRGGAAAALPLNKLMDQVPEIKMAFNA